MYRKQVRRRRAILVGLIVVSLVLLSSHFSEAESGPLHTLVTFTINGRTISGKNHFQPQGISGVGVDTGDSYRAVGVTQDHFKASLTGGQLNQTFVNNFRIIGQGPGNNFQFHENFHLAVNANGQVTTVHDNFSANCK